MERTLTEKKLVFFSKNEKDDIDEIAANCGEVHRKVSLTFWIVKRNPEFAY